MSERVIPVIDQRNLRATVPTQAIPATGLLGDRRGRPLRDLRISVMASPAPTAATSAAITACPRKSSTAITNTCRTRLF